MRKNKKLGLKKRYSLLTRGLGWDTSYQPMDEVFPYDKYEGIKIHDWDAWEDPFRLTMDAYWKFQAEKEKKLYAVIDAHAQNNGHLEHHRRPLPERAQAVPDRGSARASTPRSKRLRPSSAGEFRRRRPAQVASPDAGASTRSATHRRRFTR